MVVASWNMLHIVAAESLSFSHHRRRSNVARPHRCFFLYLELITCLCHSQMQQKPRHSLLNRLLHLG